MTEHSCTLPGCQSQAEHDARVREARERADKIREVLAELPSGLRKRLVQQMRPVQEMIALGETGDENPVIGTVDRGGTDDDGIAISPAEVVYSSGDADEAPCVALYFDYEYVTGDSESGRIGFSADEAVELAGYLTECARMVRGGSEAELTDEVELPG